MKKKGELAIQNKVENKEFEKICIFDQIFTKFYASTELNKLGYDVVNEDGFLYAKGTHPVLLVAHMDTVHAKTVSKIVYSGSKISSPQGIGGDDRCGIYMILKIVQEINCSVLFTEDEEIGCIGASAFCKSDYVDEVSQNNNYIIEFDRKGTKDAVFYDCDNPDFTEFITSDSKFVTAWGSLSDISYVAPATKLAAVNLSCGYEKAHTTSEYVDLEVMEENIIAAKEIILKDVEKPYEYIECDYRTSSRYDDYYGYSYGYGYDYNYGSYSRRKTKEELYLIEYRENGGFSLAEVKATSEDGALVKFIKEKKNICYEDISYILTEKQVIKQRTFEELEAKETSTKKYPGINVEATFDGVDTYYYGSWMFTVGFEADELTLICENYASGASGMFVLYCEDLIDETYFTSNLSDITDGEGAFAAELVEYLFNNFYEYSEDIEFEDSNYATI